MVHFWCIFGPRGALRGAPPAGAASRGAFLAHFCYIFGAGPHPLRPAAGAAARGAFLSPPAGAPVAHFWPLRGAPPAGAASRGSFFCIFWPCGGAPLRGRLPVALFCLFFGPAGLPLAEAFKGGSLSESFVLPNFIKITE